MSTERRQFLTRALAGAGGLLLAGCGRIADNGAVNQALFAAQGFTRRMQHFFVSPRSLAREYGERDISPWFKPNGSIAPDNPADSSSTPEYRAHVAGGFKDWRLRVDGLVDRPLSLSLADIRALPSRTQITRHDCVEGWSCIGKWTGAPLHHLLMMAGLKPSARYVVFHCADAIDRKPDGSPVPYYESIGLEDANHPQTILAYAMNGKVLPVAHGAPLRLRVERQLGYKQAKYVMRVEVVDSFAHLGKGKGGFWPDVGYEWYAGI